MRLDAEETLRLGGEEFSGSESGRSVKIHLRVRV